MLIKLLVKLDTIHHFHGCFVAQNSVPRIFWVGAFAASCKSPTTCLLKREIAALARCMSVVTSLMSQIPSLTFFNHEALLITWQGSRKWNFDCFKNVFSQNSKIYHRKFWNQATFYRKCMRGSFCLSYDCHNYHFTKYVLF